MGLLNDIEARLHGAEERVMGEAERAARSQIGAALVQAGKTILPLLPEGREASLVLTKMEELESWAHRALAAGVRAQSNPTEGASEAVPSTPAAP